MLSLLCWPFLCPHWASRGHILLELPSHMVSWGSLVHREIPDPFRRALVWFGLTLPAFVWNPAYVLNRSFNSTPHPHYYSYKFNPILLEVYEQGIDSDSFKVR